MAMSVHSMCLACQHLDRDQEDKHVCSAFQEGIPEEIWMNRYDHHEPYPGDNGTLFKLTPIEEKEPVKEKTF